MKKHIFRIIIVMFGGFCLLHMILTGCPIPLFHIERLVNPKMVKRCNGINFVFETGEEHPLPLVSYIPTNEVFVVAMENGIEVATNGRCYGLLTLRHWCGNDPVRYDRRRIDLSCLAILIDPNCLQTQLYDNVNIGQMVRYIEKHNDRVNRLHKRGWDLNNYLLLDLIARTLGDSEGRQQ